MATEKQITKLEKKYGLTVVYYPTWATRLLKLIKRDGVVIDLNKYMLIDFETAESSSVKSLEATFVHEKVHETRIPDNIFGLVLWYLNYFFSRKFRFEEEARAYYAEMVFISGGKQPKIELMKAFASVMQSDVYRAFWEKEPMCTIDQAVERFKQLHKG